MNNKLKPCPFCGDEADIRWMFDPIQYRHKYVICCANKLCEKMPRTNVVYDYSEAVRRWESICEEAEDRL